MKDEFREMLRDVMKRHNEKMDTVTILQEVFNGI